MNYNFYFFMGVSHSGQLQETVNLPAHAYDSSNLSAPTIFTLFSPCKHILYCINNTVFFMIDDIAISFFILFPLFSFIIQVIAWVMSL